MYDNSHSQQPPVIDLTSAHYKLNMVIGHLLHILAYTRYMQRDSMHHLMPQGIKCQCAIV